MALPSTLHLFERPCLPGWIYPCTLDDITASLSRLPEQDLEGLWAVGLVPSTRKDNTANGRYFFAPKPTIHILSYPVSLRFKLPMYTKVSEIELRFSVECKYGIEIKREGSRYVCVWSRENLRHFILEHVLLHEVGHHVFYRQRKQQGLIYQPRLPGSEQFAQDYALRYSKKQKEVMP